jgi:hypothetical protein
VYYNDLYVNAMKGAGITIEDLRPVEGSLAESYGAYARIYELLNGQGSGSSAPPADSGDAGSGDADSGDADSGDASVNIPNPVLSEGSHTFSGNPAQAVVLPHITAYELAAGTVELSFEADTLSGLQGLLSKDASNFGTGGHLGVVLDGDDIRIRMQSTNDQTDFKIADVVKAGQSHHLALTFGAAGLKVYLDGAEVAADPWTGGLQGNAEPIVIGANQWASSATTANNLKHGFDGTVSKFNLYAETLSADDVAALATGGGTGGSTPDDPLPVDPNDAPEAVDDSLSLDEDTSATIDVLANDTDPDGDALSVQSFTQGVTGSVAKNADGTLEYTPNADFKGNDSFSYTVSDGNGGTDVATVSVTVNAVGDEPNAGGDAPNVGDVPSLLLSVGSNDFSGSLGDAVVVSHDASYELTSGTVEVEFSADKLVNRQGLVTKDAKYYGDGGHFLTLLEGDDLYVRMQNASTQTEVRVKDVIEQGQDHHLAITFGSDGLKLYLDGTEVASNGWTGGLQGNAEPMVVGANQWASSPETANNLQNPFHGEISKVNLYDEILSEQDIADLANGDAVW